MQSDAHDRVEASIALKCVALKRVQGFIQDFRLGGGY